MERWGFVAKSLEGEMLFPVTWLSLRILVPMSRCAREGNDENIIPLVLIEISCENEKVIVGIAVLLWVLRIRLVILVLQLKRRALEPIGTGRQVLMTVVIEIPESSAFTVVIRIEEAMFELNFPRETGSCGDGKQTDQDRLFAAGMIHKREDLELFAEVRFDLGQVEGSAFVESFRTKGLECIVAHCLCQ